jgi:cell division protease FtsH
MQPNPPPQQRLPRNSFLYFAVVVVLGVVFFITYGSFQSHKQTDWSYSQLLAQAKGGNVKSIDIRGQVATATDSHGKDHGVNLPSDTTPLAGTLAGEGVNVTYEVSPSSDWLMIVVPNVILLLLIGGFIWFFIRRSRPQGPGSPL